MFILVVLFYTHRRLPMSDEYNTREKKDRQSRNATGPTVPTNGNNGTNTTKRVDIASMYERGIDYFAHRDVLIELNRSGDHCGHDIWVKSAPIAIPGINYPSYFLPYRPLYTNEDYKLLQSLFNCMPDDLKEFWHPIVMPKNPNDLSLYTERLNAMQKIQARYTVANSFRDYHTHAPTDNGVFGKNSISPKTWVPATEWFDSKLKELTFDDIFVLLPPAERQILKLFIGRVAVGRSNHIPDNSNIPILHTARMAIVLLSKQAGIGKSTITKLLYGALNKCGFMAESFRETAERFGMKEAAMAHILEKDKFIVPL